MKNLLISFFLLIVVVGYSQSIPDNLMWLGKLDSLSTQSEKISFIVKRIKSDSIYKSEVILSTYISENGHIHDKLGQETVCKIIFVLSQKKKMVLLDLNQNPSYSLLLKHLDSETVDEIKTLKGIAATALFGMRGNCGVVYLIANDKKLKQKLKRN